MDLTHRRTTSLLAVFLLGLASIIAAIAVASPASAATDPSVWVGSPHTGTWCKTYDTCPKGHHIAYGGDWSADIGQGIATGTAIRLYAAPGDGRTDIRAKVETVGPACADRNLSHGGYRVTVGFYKAGTMRLSGRGSKLGDPRRREAGVAFAARAPRPAPSRSSSSPTVRGRTTGSTDSTADGQTGPWRQKLWGPRRRAP